MKTSTLIPKMSNEKVLKWYKQIKPIVRKNNKTFVFHTDLSPREVTDVSFTWLEDKKMDKISLDDLYEIKDIYMYHPYVNYMTFVPTIAEVIKQIPKRIINKVVAFEILDCLNQVKDRHHISIVRLYGKAE
ncbi:MAG: hypothetical protein E7311_00040 [Clostridiales bacterium]|nr:hypothetical protein [Clostridiales bacterium]